MLSLAASVNARTLRELFANRNFLALLIGQWASYTGDQFTLIAAIPAISALTGGNTFIAAGVAIALALPQIVFGLIGGVLVDRLDRRKAMVVTDLVRGFAVGALIFVNSAELVWIYFVAAFLVGLCGTLFSRLALLHCLPSSRGGSWRLPTRCWKRGSSSR